MSVAEPVLSGEVRAAARGVVALAVLQTFGRAFGLSFALVATRVLDPSQLGRYSTVSGIVLFGGFVADFGTSLAITRWISRDPDATDHVLGGTLACSLGIGVVTYIGAVTFALLAGYPEATTVDVMIGALALVASAVGTSLFAAMDGRGMLDRRAVITFVQSAVVGLGGLTVLVLGYGVRAAVVMIAVGPFIAAVLAAMVLRRSGAWRSRVTLNVNASKQLLLDALPYAILAGLAAFTLRFDLVFVSVVSSAAETARYDLALRSAEALTYLGSVLAAPAIFLLTRRLERRDTEAAQRALNEAARFSYLAGLPLSGLLAVLAVPAVALLYGAEYANVSTPLAVLAGQLWLGLLVALLGSTVIAAGLGRAVIPVSASVALTGLVLDLALVPRYGATGAAVAAVAAQVVAVGGFAWFTYARVGLRLPWPGAPVLLATATAVVVTLAARASLGLAAGIAGLAVYGALVVLLGAVTRTDVAVLRSALRGGAVGHDELGAGRG